MTKQMADTIMKHIAKHTHKKMYGRINVDLIENTIVNEWWTGYLKKAKKEKDCQGDTCQICRMALINLYKIEKNHCTCTHITETCPKCNKRAEVLTWMTQNTLILLHKDLPINPNEFNKEVGGIIQLTPNLEDSLNYLREPYPPPKQTKKYQGKQPRQITLGEYLNFPKQRQREPDQKKERQEAIQNTREFCGPKNITNKNCPQPESAKTLPEQKEETGITTQTEPPKEPIIIAPLNHNQATNPTPTHSKGNTEIKTTTTQQDFPQETQNNTTELENLSFWNQSDYEPEQGHTVNDYSSDTFEHPYE